MDAEGIRRVVQEAEARMEASYKRELVDFRTDVADQLQLQNTVVGARFAVVEAGAQIRDVRMANNRLVPVSQEK